MNRDYVRSYGCKIQYNGDIIWISTSSGYGIYRDDYKFEPYILHGDVNDHTLGSAAINSLQRSRWVLPHKDDEFDYPDGVEFDKHIDDLGILKYTSTVKNIMRTYGYKKKADLYANMKLCTVIKLSDIIKITPSLHKGKYDSWSFKNETEAVIIPSISAASDVGAAIRLGLSRCIG